MALEISLRPHQKWHLPDRKMLDYLTTARTIKANISLVGFFTLLVVQTPVEYVLVHQASPFYVEQFFVHLPTIAIL